jgi:hypothetical protein
MPGQRGSERRHRTRIVTLALSDAEHHIVRQRAAHSRGPATVLARKLICATPQREKFDLAAAVDELQTIGNTLNRMARTANLGQAIEVTRLEDLIASVVAAIDRLPATAASLRPPSRHQSGERPHKLYVRLAPAEHEAAKSHAQSARLDLAVYGRELICGYDPVDIQASRNVLRQIAGIENNLNQLVAAQPALTVPLAPALRVVSQFYGRFR